MGKHLVLEHLERVSGRVMDDYPEILRAQLRGRAGVYALYRKDRLYYVGLASNLTVRLKQHQKDHLRGKWDRFSVYLTSRDEHIKELESLILRVVEPRGNRTGGRLVHSKDLRAELRHLIAASDAENLAVLMGGPLIVRRQRQKPSKKSSEKTSKKPSKKSRGPLKVLLGARRPLRGYAKGYEYRALLRRDGIIEYGPRPFPSPSAAATAALGRASNGWAFWQYRDGSGQWVPLKNLRS